MRFVKMHGLGNDYVYIDLFSETVSSPSALAVEISDRRFGVGSDGLILIGPSDRADFRMRMFNADGSESEMCGNGIRCVGKYVYDHGKTGKTSISIETLGGIKQLTLFISESRVKAVRVDMGRPILERSDIPMLGPDRQNAHVVREALEVEGQTFHITAVSMGNPHCVIFVESAQDAPVTTLGPIIEKLPVFPNRTNVEFVEVFSRSEARMRVWERGSGETLACGTGACASLVAGVLTGVLDSQSVVHLLGGDLDIEWAEDGHVYMTGPAVEVYTGKLTPGGGIDD